MNGMYEELLEKLRKNNRMSGWTHIDRLMDDAIKAIEALQQENEQLQTQAARMKNAIQYVLYHLRRGGKSWIIDKLEPALSTTPADYHNPADVEALRKAREAIKAAWSDGSANAAMDKASEALAAIDRAIGGKEDV
jgi:uncharacterized damage-inducible protein DinB